jgi:hypothetical protein
VRASFNHPYIDQAVALVASEYTNNEVITGMSPEVDSCTDYVDSKGHLTDDAGPRIGEKIGKFYSGTPNFTGVTPSMMTAHPM